MNKNHKSYEELLQELQELKAENASLKTAYLNEIAEIKKIEKKSGEIEARYKTLFINAAEGILVSDLKTTQFVFANPSVCKIFGYSQDEFLQLKVSDIHPKEFLEQAISEFDKIAQKLKSNVFDIPCLRKDGSIFYVNINGSPIVFDEVEYNVVFFTEVTDMRIAIEALKESEAKYRSLFENLTNGFTLHEVITDDNGQPVDFRFIVVNNYFKEISGFEPEEVKGKTIKEIQPNADINMMKKYWDVGITGIPFVLEYYSYSFKKHIKVNCYSPKKGFFATIYEDITERKNSEEALSKSKEQLREILENSISVSYKRNLTTNKYDYISPAIFNILGYTSEEFKEFSIQNVLKMMYPEDITITNRQVTSNLGDVSKTNFNINYRLRHKNGEYRWLHDQFKVLRDNNGNALSIIGSVSDITERKNYETQIQNLINELQITLNTVTAGISHIKNRKVEWANRRHDEMFGFEAGETTGMETSEFYVDQDSFHKIGKSIYAQIENGEIFSNEFKMKRKDGTIFDCFMTGQLLNKRNPSEGSIWMLQDITERKLIEKNLKESEARFKNMFVNHNAIMLLIEPESGKIILANKSASVFYGYTVSELCSMNILQINTLENEQVAKERIKAKEEKRNFFIFPHKLANGEIRTVEVHSSPIEYEGNVILFSIIIDITERRLAEEELKVSEERFSTFMNHLPATAFIKDIYGRNLYFNKYLIDLMGFKNWENKFNYELIPDDVALKVSEDDRKALEEGICMIQETLKVAGGELRTFETIKFPIKVDGIAKLLGGIAVDITERKQAEEALKYERQRLSSILEGTNVGTWEWNIQTGETVFNERWAEIIGYNLEEISPVSIETWMKFAHPDDLKVSGELLQRHFNGELDYYDFESRMKHKNGEWIWIYDRGKVHQWDENGNPLLMSGTHLDITERKRIEWTLRESEEKISKLISNIGEVIGIIRVDGIMKYKSPNIERFFGWKPEDLIGTDGWLTVHPDDLERIQKEFFKLISKDYSVSTVEYRYKCKDGSYKPIELTAANFINDPIIGGVLMNYHDITERKQAEEELFQSTQHLKAVYDIIGTGIVLINSENQTILDVNKSASELIGLPPDEIIGKVCQKFICSNEVGHCPVKDLHKEVENCERKLVNHNGEQKDIIKTVYPIKYKGMDCYLESFMDITELKKQEKELKRVNDDLRETQELIEDNLFQKNALIEELSETKEKLEQINSEKDKFFSIIAHDLRSPFSGFLGLTKMMAEEINDLSMRELQELSVNMKESANNLYKLLDNLLEWSRMQRGMTKFYPEICPLAFIAKEVLAVQSEVAKAKEIELFNRIPDGITITADISMLNTVLRNLISNALKFTPRGGKIEIGIIPHIPLDKGELKGDIIIYIKDSGIGMTADTISKLFKLDENVSQKGTEGEPSTGLGLLLCKDFIVKHGGRIWVESEVGKGSTFYFTIPYGK